MSLELFNEPSFLSRKFSREFLEKALALGRMYGWRPLGTRPPTGLNLYLLNAEWDGTYLTNDGQVVSAEDARSLACALEKSLDDIPDHNMEMNWPSTCWLDDLPEWLSPEEMELVENGLEEHAMGWAELHPFMFFAGNEKPRLIHFMRFCRLGSFTIL